MNEAVTVWLNVTCSKLVRGGSEFKIRLNLPFWNWGTVRESQKWELAEALRVSSASHHAITDVVTPFPNCFIQNEIEQSRCLHQYWQTGIVTYYVLHGTHLLTHVKRIFVIPPPPSSITLLIPAPASDPFLHYCHLARNSLISTCLYAFLFLSVSLCTCLCHIWPYCFQTMSPVCQDNFEYWY